MSGALKFDQHFRRGWYAYAVRLVHSEADQAAEDERTLRSDDGADEWGLWRPEGRS